MILIALKTLLWYLKLFWKQLKIKPYFKPTQVDRQNILKLQDNCVEGTRQIDSVTQGKRGSLLEKSSFKIS